MATTLFVAGAGAALALMLPLPTLQDSAQPASEVDVLQARRDLHSRLTVPVQIGEHGPFDFLIDTGAERTVLSHDTAARIGLVPSGSATLMGVAGTQQVQLVEVDEINLGRRSFYGLSAPLLEGRFIGADGIIGLDSLQDQRVLLDFRNNRLAIDDAKHLGGNAGYEIVVTARRRSGQLIVTDALVDGVRTDIVIDTGAETSIGNLALQKALAEKHKGEPSTLVSVTGQQVTADSGYARTLTFGKMTLNNTLLAFTDAPPFERLGLNKRPALLLGMSQLRMFKRVAIDFKSRRVLFDLPDEVASEWGRKGW
jgi:predicted aspartyl protease